MSFNPNWTSTVLPIAEQNGNIKIGGTEGEHVEYVLKMGNLPEEWLLSGLLENDSVSKINMTNIAGRISEIHSNNPVKD